MKALLNNHYLIEVIKKIDQDKSLLLHISYSRKQHPDFEVYLSNVHIKKTPIIYSDDDRQYLVTLHGCSLARTSFIDEAVENEDIYLCEDIYGEIVKDIPIPQKRSFALSRSYGTLIFQKISKL